VFGCHIENESDYSRTLPSIIFRIQRENPHQSGDMENFRIQIAVLAGREREEKGVVEEVKE